MSAFSAWAISPLSPIGDRVLRVPLVPLFPAFRTECDNASVTCRVCYVFHREITGFSHSAGLTDQGRAKARHDIQSCRRLQKTYFGRPAHSGGESGLYLFAADR